MRPYRQHLRFSRGSVLHSTSKEGGRCHKQMVLRAAHSLSAVVFLIALAGCGGNGNDAAPPPPAPSNLKYAQATITATAGVAISPDVPTVTGTVDSYKLSPALPAGVSLNGSTGTISGTPTAASAQASYTVTASNSGGSTAATVKVAVSPAPPANLTYPQTAITAIVGVAISPDVPTVTGTVDSYKISPALPAGLTLDASTGTISGTPTAASGQATHTVTATNSGGSTTTKLTIAVNPAPPSNLSYSQTTITASVGVAISPDSPTVTGTVAMYTVSPALPAGLRLDAGTGLISGIPTTVSAQATYTVTASNSYGSTTATLTITVNPAPPSSLAYAQIAITATVGVPIAPDVPTVTGTVDSYTVSPALPAGLNLDPVTGTVSGTPTVATATAVYLVTASNSAGSTTGGLKITVINPGAPSNLTYPATAISASVGVAIVPDTPWVTGTVDSYTVSPALPAGLSLNAATGAISGTPTAVTAKASYTVTGSNSKGSATASLSIEVVIAPAPSKLTYPQTTIHAFMGEAMVPDVPSLNGTADSYSVGPALPDGLMLSQTTGMIYGSPTTLSAQEDYTVTAQNANGAATAVVTISVGEAPITVLDLGLGGTGTLRMSGDRLLTFEGHAVPHWVLWDYGTGAMVASGDSNAQHCPLINLEDYCADMAGQTVAVVISNALELFSAADGHMTALIPYPGLGQGSAWFRLASDGSYAVLGSASDLRIYSPSGSLMAARQGSYSSAIAYAAPQQVQLATWVAGAAVIETVSAADATSTISAPFSGTFSSWFADGQNFITKMADAVWVYSNTGIQKALFSSSGDVEGDGNWVWTVTPGVFPSPGTLNIYAVGSQTPSLSIPGGGAMGLSASAHTLAVGYSNSNNSIVDQVSIVDLSGATPTKTDYSLPALLGNPSGYAAASAAKWVIEGHAGMLLDGPSVEQTPRYFGHGSALSIAAAPGTVVASTELGEILDFDVAGSALEQTLGFLAGKLALSSDSFILGAMGGNGTNYEADRTLNFYSLPSGTLISSFPYSLSGAPPSLSNFGMSDSGTTMYRALSDSSVIVTPVSGSPVILSYRNETTQLSPDGTWVAKIDNIGGYTYLFQNGQLMAPPIPGYAIAWMDNSSILVNEYADIHGGNSYTNAVVYNTAGVPLRQAALPQLYHVQAVTSDEVYDIDSNTIYSLSTGQPVWTGSLPSWSEGAYLTGYYAGAVAGQYIVYQSGHRVVMEKY